MEITSLASHDFRGDAPKCKSRFFNIYSARSWGLIIDDQLQVDWLELSSLGDPSFNLLKPYLGPGRYIGVNWSPDVIAYNKRHGVRGQFAKTRCANALSLVRQQSPLLRRTGVFVYDSCDSIASNASLKTMDLLCDFAARQADKLGKFMLSVTFCCRGNVNTRAVIGMQKYEDWYQKHFGRESTYTTYAGRHNEMLVDRILWR